MSALVDGCFGAWLQWCMAALVHGCFGVWVHCCLAELVHGCFGAWLHPYSCTMVAQLKAVSSSPSKLNSPKREETRKSKARGVYDKRKHICIVSAKIHFSGIAVQRWAKVLKGFLLCRFGRWFCNAGVTLSQNLHKMAIRIWNFEFRTKMAPNLVNSQCTAKASTIPTEGHRVAPWRREFLK